MSTEITPKEIELSETPIKTKKKTEVKLSKENTEELKKGGDIRDTLKEKFSETMELYKNIEKRIKVQLIDEDTIDVDFTVISKVPYDNEKINYRYMNNGFRIVFGVDGLGKGEIILRRNNKNNGSTKVLKKLIQIDKKDAQSRCNEIIEDMFQIGAEAVEEGHQKYHQKMVEEMELYLKENSTGVFTNFPERAYHLLTSAESNSSTNFLDETYNHYEYYKMHGGIKKTEAMVLGSLAHMKTLEPQRFKKEVYHTDHGKQKTEDKMHHRIFGISQVGKTSLSTKQENSITVMNSNFNSHPVINLLHKESKFEVTVFYKILNTQYRSRLDGIIENPSDELVNALVAMDALPFPADIIKNSVIVWDYKTTLNASEREFKKEIAKRKYHIQGGGYVEAIKQNYGKNVIYIIVAGEKVAPFQLDYHVIHENDLDYGLQVLIARTQKLEAHKADSKLWGGYNFVGKGFVEIPNWAKDEELAGKEESPYLDDEDSESELSDED